MVRFGTDCSGIDAAWHALCKCTDNIDYRFASDISPRIREYLQHTTNPAVVYDDLTTRDNDAAEAVDLYVAGFPCQSFSCNGKRAGFEDERGLLIFHIVEYLRRHPPKVFVLENVKGLTYHQGGETFRRILQLFEAELPQFRVQWQVLNPLQIGFPHSRARVFIVGVNSDVLGEWQPPIDLTPSLVRIHDVLLTLDEAVSYHPNCVRELTAKQTAQIVKWKPKIVDDGTIQILNLSLSKTFDHSIYNNRSPCLTRNCTNLFIVQQHRFMTAIEGLRLQGFPDDDVSSYLGLFDPNKKNKTIAALWAGNSINIPCLERLLRPIVEKLESL